MGDSGHWVENSHTKIIEPDPRLLSLVCLPTTVSVHVPCAGSATSALWKQKLAQKHGTYMVTAVSANAFSANLHVGEQGMQSQFCRTLSHFVQLKHRLVSCSAELYDKCLGCKNAVRCQDHGFDKAQLTVYVCISVVIPTHLLAGSC